MDAATTMPSRVEAERLLSYAQKPRSVTSPRLATAVHELAGYIRRQPDVTLGELRAAFLGTGFVWEGDGKLAFSRARMALVDEFDELIETYGWGARAAEIFL
jgi:hypothetical protein